MEIVLEDLEVMYVQAAGGSSGAQEAFEVLESKLSSLKGRRFYGTFHAGDYRACVLAQSGEDPEKLGLETWTIPGGKYVREKMVDWTERIPEIGERFIALSEAYPADPERPSIEFYRSQSELHLLLPIL